MTIHCPTKEYSAAREFGSRSAATRAMRDYVEQDDVPLGTRAEVWPGCADGRFVVAVFLADQEPVHFLQKGH